MTAAEEVREVGGGEEEIGAQKLHAPFGSYGANRMAR
jgi:hypothetical protein